jgi:hypothetical protein
MQQAQREALASLRLSWAPTADDLWRPQAATHVKGLNEYAVDDVMDAFDDATGDSVASPLGVVVQARQIWSTLRQESNVELGAIRLVGQKPLAA